VRRDLLGEIPEVAVADAYVQCRFRDSRDPAGELSYVTSHEERLELIAALPLVDVDSGGEVTVGKRFGLTQDSS
jgi:hypothetical protein